MELKDFFKENSRVALAFSGGTDSAFLMYAAKAAGADVHAYYVKTAFQPQVEYDEAVSLAREMDCPLTILTADVLADERIRSNPSNRCYYCKKAIFSKIASAAATDGYDIIIDGTNASDSYDDRPGMKALEEQKVLSPLRICGITKAELRRLSKEAGVRTWDKPSYSCLATRVKAGLEITKECLEKIEAAESVLDRIGFRDYRVRTDGVDARLELTSKDMHLALEQRAEIIGELKKNFDVIAMGLEARDDE